MKLIIFIFVCISSSFTIGQKSFEQSSKEIDSLLKKATNKNELDIKRSFELLNKALVLAEETNNFDKEITVINELSRFSLTYKHDLQEANSYINRIKKILQKTDNNPKYLAEYHNLLGVIYFNNRTDRKRAYKEFKTAITILDNNNIKPNKNHLNNYGIALWTEKRYDEALKYLKRSLTNYNSGNEKDEHNEFPIMISMNIGICYSYLNQMDSSEYYLKQCLEFSLDKGTIADIYKSYTYLAVFYQENGRNELAESGKELVELNSKISQAQLTKKYYLMLLLATLFLSGFGFLLFRIRKTKQLNRISLEKELLEKERVKQEAEIELLKSQETIASKTIQLSIRDQELDKLKTSLQHHLDKSTDPQFDDLKKFLRLAKASEKRNDQLKFLDELVKNTNNVFYIKLKEKHPNLTQSELKLSLLINLNLSSNDLIEIFNISLSSLNTKRYRLRKKLNLSNSDSLEDYLMNFQFVY